MPKSKQIVTIGLWGAMVVLMIAIVASGVWPAEKTAAPKAPFVAAAAPKVDPEAAGQVLVDPTEAEILFDVPTFNLTDQNEKPVSNLDLRGHVWIGAFMFTECPGVCPMMSKQMALLQETVAGSDVKIVSFSLDPDHDTPAIRRAYLERIKGDPTRWLYLAGSKDVTYDLAKQMKIAAMPAAGQAPIVHGAQVALVGRDGKIRNYYTGTDADSMRQLGIDAAKLAAK